MAKEGIAQNIVLLGDGDIFFLIQLIQIEQFFLATKSLVTAFLIFSVTVRCWLSP